MISLISQVITGVQANNPVEIDSHELGPVYIAYAGPYSSSPSSAFGHLVLLLPSSSAEPVPLWDVVTFGAETFDAGVIRYLGVGIMGGFLGRYQRVPFHEKTREYALLEDRDLWLVELELTTQERSALDKELSSVKGYWYPYTFFSKNCAYYLQSIISRATGAIPPPKGTVSPIGVLDAVLKSSLAGQSYFRSAESYRLADMSKEIPPSVINRLRKDNWITVAADTTWLMQLANTERRFVQDFFILKSLHERSALDERSRAGLSRLRLQNVRESSRQPAVRSTAPGVPIPSPRFHEYTRLTISYLVNNSEDSRVALRIRGALHDLSEPPLAHRPLNSLELLAVEASVSTEGISPRIDELILFSQRSLSPSSWLVNRNSWMLETIGRYGGLFGADAFHMEMRAGSGKTYRFLNSGFAYALFTVAGTGTCCKEIALAPGWETGFAWLPNGPWRAGLRWTREYDITDWKRNHERIHFFIRRDITQKWAFNLKGEAGPLGTYARFGIDWYP